MSDATAAEGPAIRDAATVIVLRDRDTRPRILMGQRGAKAAFMPNKFVFPGGAVDPGDGAVPLAAPLTPLCTARLEEDACPGMAHALAVAAIRELWEENRAASGPPRAVAGRGCRPTGCPSRARGCAPPPKRCSSCSAPSRRRGARAASMRASSSWTQRRWSRTPTTFPRRRTNWPTCNGSTSTGVRDFDLPFITEVVLAEVAARARDDAPPDSVPFFRNGAEESLFLRLRGEPMRND